MESSTGSLVLPQIQLVPIGLFDEAEWNPPERTTDRATTDLLNSMKKYGYLMLQPVLVVRNVQTGRLKVADGNRRLYCARKLKIEEISAIIAEGWNAQELYALVNGTSRGTTMKQISSAVAHGLTAIPPAHQRVFNNLLTVYEGDWNKIRQLAERGVNLSIIRDAQRIANYCGFGIKQGEQETYRVQEHNEMIARTIPWLIKWGTWTVKLAMSAKIDPGILLQKISDDQPLRSQWD